MIDLLSSVGTDVCQLEVSQGGCNKDWELLLSFMATL